MRRHEDIEIETKELINIPAECVALVIGCFLFILAVVFGMI